MDETQMKSMVEQINKLVTEIKSVKETENMKDPLVDQKFDKMTAELTAKGEALQKAQAEVKAVNERLEAVEASLKRVGKDGTEKDEKMEMHKKAFESYVRTGEVPQGFKKLPDGSIEIRALSTEVDSDGGYLVRPEFSQFIMGRVFETSPIRSVARVERGSSKSLTILVDDDEAAANNTGEGSASSDTDTPELGEREIFAHKYDAEPQATIEMLQDSFLNAEAWLQGKAADKIARLQNTDFVLGNGVGKCRGFMTYSAWSSAGVYERGKIEQVNSGATAALTGDGLISLQNSLKEAYQGNATFLMKRGTYGAILKLKGSDNYFFSPTLLRDGQNRLELLGKPVVFCDDIAAVSAGNLAIAYGDFSVGYTVYDRVGIMVLRDPYTNKARVKFYVSQRTGGDVSNFDAIKIQKVAA